MNARDLLTGIRTNAGLALNALEQQGIRVIRVEVDRLSFLTVQISGTCARAAGSAFGSYVARCRDDAVYPFKLTWYVSPTIKVFALVTAEMAKELGLTEKDASTEAAVEAVGASQT